MRIKESLADLVGAVGRLEESFAPGSESSELASMQMELLDPERYRANWEEAVTLLEKHLRRVEKQGVHLQKLLHYSFVRLDDLEGDVEQRDFALSKYQSEEDSIQIHLRAARYRVGVQLIARFGHKSAHTHLMYGFHVWASLVPENRLSEALDEAAMSRHLIEQYNAKSHKLGLTHLSSIGLSLQHGALMQLWTHWKRCAEVGKKDRDQRKWELVKLSHAGSNIVHLLRNMGQVLRRHAWNRWVHTCQWGRRQRELEEKQRYFERHAVELVAGRHEAAAIMCHAMWRRWNGASTQQGFESWKDLLYQRAVSDIWNDEKEEQVVQAIHNTRFELGLKYFHALRRRRIYQAKSFTMERWKQHLRVMAKQHIATTAKKKLLKLNKLSMQLYIGSVRDKYLMRGFSAFIAQKQQGYVDRLSENTLLLKFKLGSDILRKCFRYTGAHLQQHYFQDWAKVVLEGGASREVEALKEEVLRLRFASGNSTLAKFFTLSAKGRNRLFFDKWKDWTKEARFEGELNALKENAIKALFRCGTSVLAKFFNARDSARKKRGFVTWVRYTEAMLRMIEIENLKTEVISLRMQTGCSALGKLMGSTSKGLLQRWFVAWRKFIEESLHQRELVEVKEELLRCRFRQGGEIIVRFFGTTATGKLTFAFRKWQGVQHDSATWTLQKWSAACASGVIVTAMEAMAQLRGKQRTKVWVNEARARGFASFLVCWMGGKAWGMAWRFKTVLQDLRTMRLENACKLLRAKLLGGAMHKWKQQRVYLELDGHMRRVTELNVEAKVRRIRALIYHMVEKMLSYTFYHWVVHITSKKGSDTSKELKQRVAEVLRRHAVLRMRHIAKHLGLTVKTYSFTRWRQTTNQNAMRRLTEQNKTKCFQTAIHLLEHVRNQHELGWSAWGFAAFTSLVEEARLSAVQRKADLHRQKITMKLCDGADKKSYKMKQQLAFKTWQVFMDEEKAVRKELGVKADRYRTGMLFLRKLANEWQYQKLRAGFGGWHHEVVELVHNREAARTEELLLQQMENSALAHLKGKLAQQAARGMAGMFAAWKDAVFEAQIEKSAAEAEAALLAQLDSKALTHLKGHMARQAMRGMAGGFATWKADVAETITQRHADEAEAKLMEKLEMTALSHLRAKMKAAATKGMNMSFSEWRTIWEEKRAAEMAEKMDAAMNQKATQMLRRRMEVFGAKFKSMTFNMWKDLVVEKHAAELAEKALGQMNNTALAFIKKRMQKGSRKIFQEWHSAVIDSKAAAIEEKIMAQLENSALSHLKSKLAEQAAKGKASCFAGWKDLIIELHELRQAEEAELALLEQLDSRALTHLKGRMERMALKGKTGVFAAWKKVLVEKHLAKQAAEAEEALMARLELSAANHLKARMQVAATKGISIAFSAWRSLWDEKQEALMGAKMDAAMDQKAVQMLKRRMEVFGAKYRGLTFNMWKEIVVEKHAAALEAKMMAQMDSSANQFLKRHMQSAMQVGFSLWKDLIVEKKARELEKALEGQMDKAGMQFLQKRLQAWTTELTIKAYNCWRKLWRERQEEKLNALLDAQMDDKALAHLRHRMHAWAAKTTVKAFTDWKDLLHEAQVEKSAEEARKALGHRLFSGGIRLLQSIFKDIQRGAMVYSMSIWTSCVMHTKELAMEELLLQQMEVTALNFLKSRLTSQVSHGFHSWKGVVVEKKAAQLQSEIEARMEEKGLQHLKQRMGNTKHVFFAEWKEIWKEACQSRFDAEMAGRMDLKALNHLKMKMREWCMRSKVATFGSWKAIWQESALEKQTEEAQARMHMQLQGHGIRLLQKMFQAAASKTFTGMFVSWKEITHDTKLRAMAEDLERQLEQQMEDKASVFLKSKVAAFQGNALKSGFMVWQGLLKELWAQRNEEEMAEQLALSMEAKGLGFLKMRLAKAADKALKGAWSMWYGMHMEEVELRREAELEEALLLQMEGKALLFLKQQVAMRGMRGQSQCFACWKFVWAEATRERNQAEMELMMAAQLEGTAIAHLKAKLAAKNGNRLQAVFTSWVFEVKEARTAREREALERRLEINMESKSLAFLKSKMVRGIGKAMVLWKSLWDDSRRARDEARIEAMLEANMEAKGLSFLKMRLAKQTKAIQRGSFEAWRAEWYEAKTSAREQELAMQQAERMLQKVGIRMKLGVVHEAFRHWDQCYRLQLQLRGAYQKGLRFINRYLTKWRKIRFVLLFHFWKTITRETVLTNIANSEHLHSELLQQRLDAAEEIATMAVRQHDEQAASQLELLRHQFALRKLVLLRRTLVKDAVKYAYSKWHYSTEKLHRLRQLHQVEKMRSRITEERGKVLQMKVMSAWKQCVTSTLLSRSGMHHTKTMRIMGAISVRRIFKHLKRQALTHALSRWVLVLVDGLESGAKTQVELVHKLNNEVRRIQGEMGRLAADKASEAEYASSYAAKAQSLQQELQHATSKHQQQLQQNSVQLQKAQEVAAEKGHTLTRQVEDLQGELDVVLAQKARLEARMKGDHATEQQYRDECEVLRAQLHALQDDYDRLRRSSQTGGPIVAQLNTLKTLHEQDRREKQRLRDELNASRGGGGGKEDSTPSRVSFQNPRPRSPKSGRGVDWGQQLAVADAEVQALADEIRGVEESLSEVSGELETQLSSIRIGGAAPPLLKGAKGTMERGNELTKELERLNARKEEAEEARDRLKENMLGRSRSRSASPPPSSSRDLLGEVFSMIDKDGNGVIDRAEWNTAMRRAPRNKPWER